MRIDIGYTAPNVTTNVGADYHHYTAASSLRLGSAITSRTITTSDSRPQARSLRLSSAKRCWRLSTDNSGALRCQLRCSCPSGYYSAALQPQRYTTGNANKAIQFDQDLAWFKSGWKGTHNFKFGYQLNRLVQRHIDQHCNEPYVQCYPGSNGAYTADNARLGNTNCAPVSRRCTVAIAPDYTARYVRFYDFGTTGQRHQL